MPDISKKNGQTSTGGQRVWSEPPLTRVAAITVKSLFDLRNEASGQRVLEKLSAERGRWLDPTGVYGPIRQALNRKEGPYLEKVGERPSPHGGPPLMIYKLSAEGLRALRETIAHHKELAAYLEAGLPDEDADQRPEKTELRKRPRTEVRTRARRETE